MTVPGCLRGAQLKIERARKHVSDLDIAIRQFHEKGPYKISTKRDPDTRRLIYYVSDVEPPPDEIAVIAGEVVQCLSSALDQTAYQLWLAGSRSGSERRVYFPAFDAAKSKAKLPIEIQGMGQRVVDAFDAIEPHKGGKGHSLWVLSELNNTDKHRLLITVGAAYRSVDIGPMLMKMQESHWKKSFGETISLPAISLGLRPADRLCPMKPGDELFTTLPDAELDQNIKFAFDISLHEPGVVESEPLLPTLHQVAKVVEDTVAAFAAFL